jgi:biopolymer transport protein TolR
MSMAADSPDFGAEAPLSPAQRSKIRRLSRPKEAEPGEEAGELALVPYLDIIMNVLMFVLAGIAITFVTNIDTEAPSAGGAGTRMQVDQQALNLSVWITDAGISLKTTGGNVSPSCNGDASAGLTVPKQGDAHNLTRLTECASFLKYNLGGGMFEGETQVMITANPGTEFGTIVDVIDALRADKERELFPEVRFGVAK